MIFDKHIDIETEWPVPLTRESALHHLAELIEDQETAQTVWNDIVAPLYDRVSAQRVYGGSMNCRICGRPHAASYRAVSRAAKGLPRLDHAMYCANYVGPLEHRKDRCEPGLIGERTVCVCGATYQEGERCPQANVDWRGPR